MKGVYQMNSFMLIEWVIFFVLLLGGLVVAKAILYLLRDILD